MVVACFALDAMLHSKPEISNTQACRFDRWLWVVYTSTYIRSQWQQSVWSNVNYNVLYFKIYILFYIWINWTLPDSLSHIGCPCDKCVPYTHVFYFVCRGWAFDSRKIDFKWSTLTPILKWYGCKGLDNLQYNGDDGQTELNLNSGNLMLWWRVFNDNATATQKWYFYWVIKQFLSDLVRQSQHASYH